VTPSLKNHELDLHKNLIEIKIGLVQINANFSGQEYLPLSVGMLWSYLKEYSKFRNQLKLEVLAHKREDPMHLARKLSNCNIVGFSLYVWNEQISLMTMKYLRQINPEVLIVCGGPQVPDDGAAYLEKYTFIDFLVHGEGEVIFENLVERLVVAGLNPDKADLDLVGSLSFSKESNTGLKFVSNKLGLRLKELDIPSPFLDGTFDELIFKNPEQKWMALWETNRGCPFTCTFCDWGSATNAKVSRFNLDRLEAEFDWIASNEIEFVFICDANFGLLPRDLEIARMVVGKVKKLGFPKRISTQGAKNVTDRSYEVQKILMEAAIGNGAALSMQSLDSKVLEAIKRDNISLESYYDLQNRYRAAGIPTYVDLIIGLPEETLSSFKSGITRLIENGAHEHIQFNNLTLLPNAEMNKHRDKFGLKVITAPVWALHADYKLQEDFIREKQDLVIATKSLPIDDWREARLFAWMTSLVHLNKIAQPLMLLTHNLSGQKYSEIIDLIIKNDDNREIAGVVNKLRKFARIIQGSGQEYFSKDDYLGINWTADEFIFIELVVENRLESFVKEIQQILLEIVLQSENKEIAPDVIIAAFEDSYNLSIESLMLPGQTKDRKLDLNTNVLEVIEDEKRLHKTKLVRCPSIVNIQRTNDESLLGLTTEEWMKKVVWYRNKRGAYTWDIEINDNGLPEGHFR
jgi:radical SAM superfamily enzyme YgiQ (UPF0313 family)